MPVFLQLELVLLSLVDTKVNPFSLSNTDHGLLNTGPAVFLFFGLTFEGDKLYLSMLKFSD